jgi:hypothetical protein
MNLIVANILEREAAASRIEMKPFSVVSLFCGMGLVAALGLAFLGFDLGAGIF